MLLSFIFIEYLDYLLFLSLQIEPYIQKGNEGFVHHFLVYECHGDYNESHYGFGVDCKDIANMPFLKCFYGKVLAVWGVGGEVRILWDACLSVFLQKTMIIVLVGSDKGL